MDKRWYVVHTQSGYEAKVKMNLENQIEILGVKEKISRVLIPTEDVAEVRGGKKKVTTRKFFPGYILVEMVLDEKTWYIVKQTPGVTGFVGSGRNPIPLKEEEIESIIRTVEEKKTKPKPKVLFSKGEGVRVIEGPFANFNGVVEEINSEKGKLKVMVTIFGRSTPVELEFWQVEKM